MKSWKAIVLHVFCALDEKLVVQKAKSLDCFCTKVPSV